jgi:hypothetical protein
MVSQSVTTYLPKELAERLAAAKAAGAIDPKTVIKDALEHALDGTPAVPGSVPGTGAAAQLQILGEFLGTEEVRPLWTGEEGTPVEVACRIIERAAYPLVQADDAGDVAYELVWSENLQEFQARLDSVTEAGGRPISVAISSQDRVCLLVGWKT